MTHRRACKACRLRLVVHYELRHSDQRQHYRPKAGRFDRYTQWKRANFAHPIGFSRRQKAAERSAAVVLTYVPKAEQNALCKSFDLRSPKVMQPAQVKLRTCKMSILQLYGCAVVTALNRSVLNFQGYITSSISKIRLSQICYIDDLGSGQIRDLPIIRQWGKFKCFRFKKTIRSIQS